MTTGAIAVCNGFLFAFEEHPVFSVHLLTRPAAKPAIDLQVLITSHGNRAASDQAVQITL